MAQNEDISANELFGKLKYWFQYLLSQWLTIAALVCVGGLLGFFLAYIKKPSYTSEVSFVLSNESTNLSFSILASQFGFGGSSGGDIFSSQNITSIFRSKTILSKTLFKKADSKETLFDIYVKEENFKKKWTASTHLQKALPFPQTLDQLTPLQDSIVRNAIDNMLKNSIVSITQPDKNTSVYVVGITYSNERFAYLFSKYLVDETSKYYIDTKTSLARQNLNLLQTEADSLLRILTGNIRYAAAEQDRTFNLNPAMQRQRSSIQITQANSMATQAAYAEVVKSLELAKLDLQKTYPLYQIIDTPSLPLTKITDSQLKNIVLYAIGFGAVAAMVLLAIRFLKIIRNS